MYMYILHVYYVEFQESLARIFVHVVIIVIHVHVYTVGTVHPVGGKLPPHVQCTMYVEQLEV